MTLFGEVGGRSWPSPRARGARPTGADVAVRRIGTVGGDDVLGIELDELERAYGGDA
jgi:hypothetical protein